MKCFGNERIERRMLTRGVSVHRAQGLPVRTVLQDVAASLSDQGGSHTTQAHVDPMLDQRTDAERCLRTAR